MSKQRKRSKTEDILNAANWVRENIHILNGQSNTQTQWCEILSAGVGIEFTVPTAVQILQSNGVEVVPPKPADSLEVRVLSLEQQVAKLMRAIYNDSPYDEADDGLLPLQAFGEKTESEVADVFARS